MLLLIVMMASYMASMGYFSLDEVEVIETHAYDGESELWINNDVGDITLRSQDRETIEIIGIKKTYFGKDELDKIDIKVEKGDHFKITVDRDDEATWVWMELKVSIPINMLVHKVEVDTGDLNVEDIQGDALLSSDTGDVNIEGGKGNFTLITQTGDLNIADLDHIVKATADTGKIMIERCDQVDLVESDTGRINIKDCGTVKVVTCDTGEVDVTISYLTSAGLRVNSDTGDIQVNIPSDLACNFTIDSDTGNIEVKGLNDLGTGNDNFRTGILNGGGPLIELMVDTGKITLQSREG